MIVRNGVSLIQRNIYMNAGWIESYDSLGRTTLYCFGLSFALSDCELTRA